MICLTEILLKKKEVGGIFRIHTLQQILTTRFNLSWKSERNIWFQNIEGQVSSANVWFLGERNMRKSRWGTARTCKSFTFCSLCKTHKKIIEDPEFYGLPENLTTLRNFNFLYTIFQAGMRRLVPPEHPVQTVDNINNKKSIYGVNDKSFVCCSKNSERNLWQIRKYWEIVIWHKSIIFPLIRKLRHYIIDG